MSNARRQRAPRLAACLAAALVVLLSASRAAPDLQVEGDLAYKDSVVRALTSIKQADPRLDAVITKLQRSKNLHKIKDHAENVNSNTASNGDNAINGTGTGTTTKWNPTLDGTFTDPNVKRDPTASLIHELNHAAEADMGMQDETEQGGIPVVEITAVTTENIYRGAKGLTLRTKYGANPIPTTTTTTTTSTTTTTTSTTTTTTLPTCTGVAANMLPPGTTGADSMPLSGSIAEWYQLSGQCSAPYSTIYVRVPDCQPSCSPQHRAIVEWWAHAPGACTLWSMPNPNDTLICPGKPDGRFCIYLRTAPSPNASMTSPLHVDFTGPPVDDAPPLGGVAPACQLAG